MPYNARLTSKWAELFSRVAYGGETLRIPCGTEGKARQMAAYYMVMKRDVRKYGSEEEKTLVSLVSGRKDGTDFILEPQSQGVFDDLLAGAERVEPKEA